MFSHQLQRPKYEILAFESTPNSNTILCFSSNPPKSRLPLRTQTLTRPLTLNTGNSFPARYTSKGREDQYYVTKCS